MEFESRCLKTDGVTPEQAVAFRSKLWQMHVDSRRGKSSKDLEKAGSSTTKFLDKIKDFDRSSSRDPIPERADIPFKERIRPGMTVIWDPPPKLSYGSPGTMSMAVILCPVWPGEPDLGYVLNHQHVQSSPVVEHDSQQYLCAIVSPGIMANSYQVDLWRHVVISKEQIKDEIILEYNSATRYYYISL